MSSRCAGFLVPLLVAGCATPPPRPGEHVLARADAQLAALNYRGARDLYGEFLAAHEDAGAAGRARGAHAALGRLLEEEAEVDQLRQVVGTRDAEVARLERALAERDAAMARLQATDREVELRRLRRAVADRQGEVDRLRAEVTRLRADLERLRSIDLTPEQRR